MDSVQHNRFVPDDSVGLRGGVIDWEPIENGSRRTLHDARFTEDVVVSSASTSIDGVLAGEFTVRGPGGRVTEVRLEGPFLTAGAEMTITLDVRDRPARFTVPAY